MEFLGYTFVGISFVVNIVIGIMGLIKLSNSPDGQAGFVLIQTSMILVINTMFSVLSLLMMLLIPEFSWWMIICFILLLGRIVPGMSGSSWAPMTGAFIMGVNKSNDAVMVFAIISVVLAWFFEWVLKKMAKSMAESSVPEAQDN